MHGVEDNVPEDLKAEIATTFGFTWEDLSPKQVELLETAELPSMP